MKLKLPLLFYSCLFTITSIVSLPKLTLAQLRLGTGIERGLEGYLLEYQQRGLPLEQIRGVSDCSVGFGASCNKTGAVLQKIVEEHSGLTQQQIIFKAAGGQENYQRFVQFYPNASAIPAIPYSSFWHDPDNSILDSYKNSGIGELSTANISNLHEIVSQFKYAPITWDNNNLNLRQGLVGLKTAYGLTLVEEALKVPEINQKIAYFSANSNEADFHQRQFHSTISALNNQYSPEFNHSLFLLLSNPYTDRLVDLNRPSLNISDNLSQIEGITLEGDEQTAFIAVTGEGNELFLPDPLGVVSEITEPNSFYIVAGIGGLTFLLLSLTGTTADSDSSNNFSPDNSIPVVNNFFAPQIENNNQGFVLAEEGVLEIPEPSGAAGIIILSSVALLLIGKKITI